MLKTNSKQARENIKKYIMDGFTPEDYGIEDPGNFEDTAKIIYHIFKVEKANDPYYKYYQEQEVFANWAAGLPSILDTCYYYNRSAIDDIAAILEQTEAEKAKYTDERKAEKFLSDLIYREIMKAVWA
jgi:hypothetical protein